MVDDSRWLEAQGYLGGVLDSRKIGL